MKYKPANWYWSAGNKKGLVFSSAAAAWIAPTDSTYQAWLAAGNAATTVLCDGELADVLLKLGMPNTMVAAAGDTSLGNLTPDDIVAVKMACGIIVTSTATPALDGTYEVDDDAQADLAAEAQYVSTFKAYSGGQTTLAWSDIAGAAHAFPADIGAAGTFMAFAKAVADYRTQVSLAAMAIAGGGSPTWPSAAITIP